MAAHVLWARTPAYTAPVSAVVARGWFFPVVIAMLLATYVALAVVFQLIQERLPGTRVVKGGTFGIAFGGLMLLGAPAMSLLYGSALSGELRIGLVDGCAICLLGLLLGLFTGTDGSPRDHPWFASAFLSVVVVGSAYFVLSVLTYLLLPFTFTAFETLPVQTLLWTLAVGLWIGLMNWLLKDAFLVGTRVRQAVTFAGLGYGVYATLNALFAPVFVATPIASVLLGAFAGIAFVAAGTWAERMISPLLRRQSASS
jgi:hypothetical protein